MPPKRFEGQFGIPESHPHESLLTAALYRLPESVSLELIDRTTEDITQRVNAARANNGDARTLSPDEITVLKLKLARHYEDNGESATIDMPTMVDALVESPRFLESDRGSIAKLFAIHEMKTLQKIAELRRKRAEIISGNSSELNPYEYLFETSSGKYALARLLNMPHLEDESTYMDHCVGTSNSYINKIKRGDVEILSFRDSATQEPLVTIEYDCKTHRLLQVKAMSDRIPTLADDFAPDLIEAIERLPETVNDAGLHRSVESKELQHLKKLLELKEKISEHNPLTKEDLLFLYEIDEPIQGFDWKPETLVNELLGARNPNEDMLIIFDCAPEHIAHNETEITPETKAYVGALTPQIIHSGIEHVYTTFPEGKLRYNIEIGGMTKEDYVRALLEKNIQITAWAKRLLDSTDFVTHESHENIDLVCLTVADLGFPEDAAISEIYSRAEEWGLELCPPETGPALCLATDRRPKFMFIGMKQIVLGGAVSLVFYLNRRGDGLRLGAEDARPSNRWSANYRFVFRSRK